jgi:hypothetical protein
MKKIIITTIALLLSIQDPSFGQPESEGFRPCWQIGFGLGELPMGGSFKPSISIGYHFTDKIYSGIVYQFRDQISRDGSSFNAQSSGLEGLTRASETVAQRFMAQVRYTPIKNGPYLSAGFVYNGTDSETMVFDERYREIAGDAYDGSVVIKQTRPAGWGLALGLGYQYNFRNGFSAGFEWTPAWLQYPDPYYSFAGTSDLSEEAESELKSGMDEGFRSSVTNMYKIFHVGVAYRFQ